MKIFGLLLLAAISSSQECLQYEPHEVTIEGKLTVQTFPGPPNFENIRKGDRPEGAWFVDLKRPICFEQSKIDPDIDVAYNNVRRVQLVISDHADFGRAQACKGKAIRVKGQLFGKHTGHHRTDVLITVKEISCG